MKLIIKILITILVILIMTSCSQKPNYVVQYSNDSKDSIVYVHYYDQSTSQWVDRYMAYVLFMNLYNMGGYSSIYGYYRVNSYDPYYYTRYHSYSYNYSPKYYYSHGYSRSSSGQGWTRNNSSPSHLSGTDMKNHNATRMNSSHSTITTTTKSYSNTRSSPSYRSSGSSYHSAPRSSPSHR